MRILYRPLWEGAVSALRDIFDEGYLADKVIQRHLKANRKWGSHDRRLFAELVYDCVRWWRRFLVVREIAWPESDRWESRFFPHAYEFAIETWCVLKDVSLDRALNRTPPAKAELQKLWDDPKMSRAERQSIPNWMDAFGAKELGSRWEECLNALNSSAPVYLRVNRLRTTRENLVRDLKSEKIEATPVGDEGLKLAERVNVFLTKSFTAGHFEVQDLNSQKVALALGAKPGERVIDACAGAGGKSLHLAAIMSNKGKIIALDVVEKKLEQLRERSTRAGATLIEAKVIESSKTIKRLKESANRVLLDVPCSGWGVFRRNPDAKWRLTTQEMSELNATQQTILNSYSAMCMPGGTLVYATCSILPSENERQVEKFLSQNETGWKLEEQQTFYPEIGGADGFYFARLTKS